MKSPFDTDKISGVSAKNAGNWSARITENEAAIIEFYMSDVMRFWGYQQQTDVIESIECFSEFYKWYNCNYFYFDAF